MPPQTIIRPLDPEQDLPLCAALIVDSFNPLHGDEWTEKTALQLLEYIVACPQFKGWVITLDGQVVCGCAGNIEPYFLGPYYHLKYMFTAPDHQGKGLGGQLLQQVQATLQEAGIALSILYTNEQHYVFDFYKKLGYQTIEGMRMLVWEGSQG